MLNIKFVLYYFNLLKKMLKKNFFKSLIFEFIINICNCLNIQSIILIKNIFSFFMMFIICILKFKDPEKIMNIVYTSKNIKLTSKNNFIGGKTKLLISTAFPKLFKTFILVLINLLNLIGQYAGYIGFMFGVSTLNNFNFLKGKGSVLKILFFFIVIKGTFDKILNDKNSNALISDIGNAFFVVFFVISCFIVSCLFLFRIIFTSEYFTQNNNNLFWFIKDLAYNSNTFIFNGNKFCLGCVHLLTSWKNNLSEFASNNLKKTDFESKIKNFNNNINYRNDKRLLSVEVEELKNDKNDKTLSNMEIKEFKNGVKYIIKNIKKNFVFNKQQSEIKIDNYDYYNDLKKLLYYGAMIDHELNQEKKIFYLQNINIDLINNKINLFLNNAINGSKIEDNVYKDIALYQKNSILECQDIQLYKKFENKFFDKYFNNLKFNDNNNIVDNISLSNNMYNLKQVCCMNLFQLMYPFEYIKIAAHLKKYFNIENRQKMITENMPIYEKRLNNMLRIDTLYCDPNNIFKKAFMYKTIDHNNNFLSKLRNFIFFIMNYLIRPKVMCIITKNNLANSPSVSKLEINENVNFFNSQCNFYCNRIFNPENNFDTHTFDSIMKCESEAQNLGLNNKTYLFQFPKFSYFLYSFFNLDLKATSLLTIFCLFIMFLISFFPKAQNSIKKLIYDFLFKGIIWSFIDIIKEIFSDFLIICVVFINIFKNLKKNNVVEIMHSSDIMNILSPLLNTQIMSNMLPHFHLDIKMIKGFTLLIFIIFSFAKFVFLVFKIIILFNFLIIFLFFFKLSKKTLAACVFVHGLIGTYLTHK